MSRDEAVRAAAEALRAACPDAGCQGHASEAADAVDAAAPHLTADLVRQRDEALAEVERLRVWRDAGWTAEQAARAERDEALAGRQADRERAAVAVLNEQLLTADAVARAERAEAAVTRAQDFADRLPGAIAETLRQHGRDDLGGLLGRIVVQVCDGFRAALRGEP